MSTYILRSFEKEKKYFLSPLTCLNIGKYRKDLPLECAGEESSDNTSWLCSEDPLFCIVLITVYIKRIAKARPKGALGKSILDFLVYRPHPQYRTSLLRPRTDRSRDRCLFLFGRVDFRYFLPSCGLRGRGGAKCFLL